MNDSWQFFNPVKLVAGIGQLHTLSEWVSGGRHLLVTSAGFTRRGMTKKITELTNGAIMDVYDWVTPNPELDDLDEATAAFRAHEVQGIIALGGGSVVDTAKVLAVTMPSTLDKPLDAVLRRGTRHEWDIKLPLVAIPTTSGTGAEVTPFATVWDQTGHKKYSVTGDTVFPDIAILDPELTCTLPGSETLHTGLDAISHALESLWNRNKTPISEMYATRSLELALQALPTVLDKSADIHARTQMQYVSLFAGLAISQTRTAIAHSISYPLTSHFDVPHGLACSFTLSNIIQDFVTAKPGSLWVQLMLDIKSMLDALNLFDRVYEYATEDQVLALTGEMYHPDRAMNYDGELSNEAVHGLISKP